MKKFLWVSVFVLVIIGVSFAGGDREGRGETFVPRANFGNAPTSHVIQGIYSNTTTRNDAKSANLTSLNWTTAKVTLDRNDRIKTIEINATEAASPYYASTSMPHFLEFGLIYVVQIAGSVPNGTGEATRTNAHDHSYMIDGEGLTPAEQDEITQTINRLIGTLTYNSGLTRSSFKAFKATMDACVRFEQNWKTKRDRGSTYGMNPNNDWDKQTNHLQTLLVGKTADEIQTWYRTYFDYAGAGRPLPLPGTTDPKYTEIKNIREPDVNTGVTMSLADGHGDILGAVLLAIANAKK